MMFPDWSRRVLPIVTTFTSTPELALRSYRACHRRGYLSRLAVTVICVIVGLGQVVVALAGVGAQPGAQLLPGVVLAVYGVFFFAFRERSVRKQLAAYLGGSRDVTFTLTDTECRTQGGDRATTRTWTTFSGVSRVGDFWVLRVSPQMAMGLPTSALDEQQTATFVSLIQEKGLS